MHPAEGGATSLSLIEIVGPLHKEDPTPLYLQLQKILRDAIDGHVVKADEARNVRAVARSTSNIVQLRWEPEETTTPILQSPSLLQSSRCCARKA